MAERDRMSRSARVTEPSVAVTLPRRCAEPATDPIAKERVLYGRRRERTTCDGTCRSTSTMGESRGGEQTEGEKDNGLLGSYVKSSQVKLR
jgi:hypothetical protein